MALVRTLQWTDKAYADLTRLYAFLAPLNPTAAVRTVQALSTAPEGLLVNPRIGKRLQEFDPREVRKILVDRYELRYEVLETRVVVLRLWHTREDR
jgi:plasmid stabilization system protein ParE